MRNLLGIALYWDVAPVRAHAFFGLSWMIQGMEGSVRRRCLIDQDWLLRVGVMRTFPGIPLFLVLAPVRAHAFWVKGTFWGLEESEISRELARYEMMEEWELIKVFPRDPFCVGHSSR